MFDEWESHRNLSQLPNFAFSVALAMFHQATIDKSDLSQANEKVIGFATCGCLFYCCVDTMYDSL
jgi:hypothetical protein